MSDPRTVLVHDSDFTPVALGTIVKDFRGESHRLVDAAPPHKENSTGRIYVVPADGPSVQPCCAASYFPSVCNLKFVTPEEVRCAN